MSPVIATGAPTSTTPSIPAECLPNYDLIVTEDDTPVDSIFAERQAKLLSNVLYASWSGPGEERPYVAMGNVGLFFALKQPPVVPDFLLSLDVSMPQELQFKENRSYFMWNVGKAPDIVIEIVSNQEGGEDDVKFELYARIGVPYYVIFDPWEQLGTNILRSFALRVRTYEPVAADFLPEIGLGLTLWDGTYEGYQAKWLRWCDASGSVLLTGEERAEKEHQRAENERQRADAQQQLAERMAAQMRAMGIEPPK